MLTALGVLLLLLVLAAGAAHMVMGASRRATDERFAALALLAADAGAFTPLRDLQGLDVDSMRIGDTLPPWLVTGSQASGVAHLQRTSQLTWTVDVHSFSPDSLSRRRAERHASLVLRQAIPVLATDAALTARDSVTVRGSGQVIGGDTATGIWALACASTALGAGVRAPDTNAVVHGSIAGAPPLIQDPAAASPATYTVFGSLTRSQLLARASHTLLAGSIVSPAPRLTGSLCDSAISSNWGEPLGTGPCARYAPILWIRGSAELRGGRGQGLLFVDGDLVVSAGAEFHGVIVLADDLIAGPGGGSIFGAVLVADSVSGSGDHSVIGDNLKLYRAPCTSAGILRRNAPLVPIVGRAWSAFP